MKMNKEEREKMIRWWVSRFVPDIGASRDFVLESAGIETANENKKLKSRKTRYPHLRFIFKPAGYIAVIDILPLTPASAWATGRIWIDADENFTYKSEPMPPELFHTPVNKLKDFA
jgi:hypothetical protein